MTDEKFRKLQMVQVSIMDDIHRVCVKNNLKYYMIGGTALGAIRHKGFIPWDVDIDIAMPREDYERFIEIANGELESKHECLTYRSVEDLKSPHILVLLKKSSIRFSSDSSSSDSFRPGIYVDILPLDQVPSDERQREKHKKELQLIKKVMFYKKAKVHPGNGRLMIGLKFITRKLFSLISWQQLYHIQQLIAMKYNRLPDTGLICSTLSHYKYEKLCMPKHVFGNPRLYEFENRKYYGPEDMQEYLTRIFGDYMKLPPLSDQEVLRNYVVDATWS